MENRINLQASIRHNHTQFHNQILLKDFKKYCFYESSFRKRVISGSSVSANTNINQQALNLIQLAYPKNLKEQQAIAEVLTDVDDLISSLICH